MFTFIMQLNLINWHGAVPFILFKSISNGLGIVFFENQTALILKRTIIMHCAFKKRGHLNTNLLYLVV